MIRALDCGERPNPSSRCPQSSRATTTPRDRARWYEPARWLPGPGIHLSTDPTKASITNIYFYTVLYHALRASNRIAIERGTHFKGSLSGPSTRPGNSSDTPTRFGSRRPRYQRTADFRIPHPQRATHRLPRRVGASARHLQTAEPAGGAADRSISYINHSTSSIHLIVPKVEIRKEGKIGRVYYLAPYMTNDNLEYYEDAYDGFMREDHRHLRRLPSMWIMGFR